MSPKKFFPIFDDLDISYLKQLWKVDKKITGEEFVMVIAEHFDPDELMPEIKKMIKKCPHLLLEILDIVCRVIREVDLQKEKQLSPERVIKIKKILEKREEALCLR